MVMCRSILVLMGDGQTKEGKTGLRQVILIKDSQARLGGGFGQVMARESLPSDDYSTTGAGIR
jgi:hypothetical protein